MKKAILLGMIIACLLSTSIGFADNGWWNSNWTFRKQIWINTTTESLTTDYTVNLTVDTSTPISQGKMLSNCDDLRVVYQNTTELDRIIHSCNTTNTWVEFRIQNQIGTNQNDGNYSIYYGNNFSGNPPHDWNKTYWFAEEFDTLDTNKWTANNGVESVNGGILTIDCQTNNLRCSLESKQKNFTLPFSLEMGNTYWSVSGDSVILRQLNATGWVGEFRAGLYYDINWGDWLWFSVDNNPNKGTNCSYDETNPHNRTIYVWNTSRADYWQDGIQACYITNQISTSNNWSVDLVLVTQLGGHAVQHTDYVIVRKLTNESTKPTFSIGSEESALPLPPTPPACNCTALTERVAELNSTVEGLKNRVKTLEDNQGNVPPHTHPISDIIGLQGILGSMQDSLNIIFGFLKYLPQGFRQDMICDYMKTKSMTSIDALGLHCDIIKKTCKCKATV